MRRAARSGLLACVAALPVALAAQPATPFCGARHLDIGGGVRLLMYMMAGDRTFSMTYDIARRNVEARDVVVAAQPIRLNFTRLNHRAYPAMMVGFENLDLREQDGREFEFHYYRLDCGSGVSLTGTISSRSPSNRPIGPLNFMSGFFVDRQRIPACLQALQRSGRFTLVFSRNQGDAPSVVAHGRVPLRQKLRFVERFWAREIARAQRGECHIMPPPPNPF